MCDEPGCEEKALAQGLCSRHYQRKRRGSTRDKPGPAPKYPEEMRIKYQGAPIVQVRLEPALWNWVQEQGGSSWLRHAVEQLRTMATTPDLLCSWEQFKREKTPEAPVEERS